MYQIIAELKSGITIMRRKGINLTRLLDMSSGTEFDCVRKECERIDINDPQSYRYLIRTDSLGAAAAACEMLLSKVNRMNELIAADRELCGGYETEDSPQELEDDAVKRLCERAEAHEMPTLVSGSTRIDLDDYEASGFAAVIQMTPPKNDPEGVDIYLADEAENNGYTVLDIRKPGYVPLFHSAMRYLHSRNSSVGMDVLNGQAEAAVNELCRSEKSRGGGYRDMAEAEHDLFDILGEKFICRLRRVYDGEKWLYEPAEPAPPDPDDPWANAGNDIEDDNSFFDRAIEEYLRDIENDPFCGEEEECVPDSGDCEEYGDEPPEIDPFGCTPITPDAGIHPFGGMPFGGGYPFGFGEPARPPMPPVTMPDIDEFIGLDNIKRRFKEIVSCFVFERKLSGGTSEGLNLVLTGPPGTAKTTIARALAKMLEEAGIIPANSFVELKKSDFVGQYVGQTEHLIDQIFLRYAGGAAILWDEIYALAGTQSTAFDEQAVTSILQNMENYRSRIVNIFIGYEEPMMRFLDANQGLRSRITDIVRFEDLDNETLAKIFRSFAEKKGIHTADDCTEMLVEYFASAKSIEGIHFGNGRTARNLFNSAFRNLANRVGYKYSEGEPLEMTRDDVRKATEDSIAEAKQMSGEAPGGESRIGFTA